MTSIVFSKDRAFQLDAFLRSYWHCVRPATSLTVLYRATSPRHLKAYGEVFAKHPWMQPVMQGADFKADVLRLLPLSGCVTCFVDDQVFLRPWEVLERPGLSLRLGLQLTYDYNSNDAPQPLPPFAVDDEGLVTWRWAEGTLAWGYPLSLDGHVFDAIELRAMVERLDFHSPNTLESQLQAYASRFAERRGACYFESRVVNLPLCLTQEDWYNRHAGLGVDDLLTLWENGKCLDVGLLYGFRNRSVHQELPLALEDRVHPLVRVAR